MDENDPVDDGEFLLRRIFKQYVRVGALFVIDRGGFTPSPSDDDGLSFFRELFTTAQVVADAAPEKKRGQYYVVRLAVRDVRAQMLTLTPKPDPEQPPGHVIIPELALGEYERRKPLLKPVQFELGRLAARDIVIRPTA